MYDYTDSDYGGCIRTGRSTIGYASILKGKHGSCVQVDWASKRQQYVSNSSAESEIIALSYALNMSIMPIAMMIETIFDIKNIKNNIKIDSKAVLQSVKPSYSITLQYLKKTQQLSIARLNEILFGENDLNSHIEYINTKDFNKHKLSLGIKTLMRQ